MALKLKASISQKSGEEEKGAAAQSLPILPVAALEEHRRSPGVTARRERVRARMQGRGD